MVDSNSLVAIQSCLQSDHLICFVADCLQHTSMKCNIFGIVSAVCIQQH